MEDAANRVLNEAFEQHGEEAVKADHVLILSTIDRGSLPYNLDFREDGVAETYRGVQVVHNYSVRRGDAKVMRRSDLGVDA